MWGHGPAIGDCRGDRRFGAAQKIFHPDGTEMRRDETPMADVLRTGVPIHERRMVIERRDGVRLSLLASIDPIYEDDGEMVGAVSCFQDISALAQVQELIQPAFTIAMLVAMQALLCGVVTDGIIDERHDSNQELLAQGVANLVAPLFGCIPVTGAVARSVARFTLAAWTPGTAAMAFSTRRTHEAQVMPSMPNSAHVVSKLCGSVFLSAVMGWSLSVTAQIDNPSKLGKVKQPFAEFSVGAATCPV